MFGVFLVVVRALLGLDFRRETGQQDVQEALDGFGGIAVAIPDRDQVAVEPDREGDAAEIVSWGCLLVVVVVVVGIRRAETYLAR